ncbi:hypothetical protein VT85_19065 [Planctomyces sp. SH-PL62]|nr:hypothetical protein VT85_19065 [Planctomyces sp. SH-PL62]
MPTRISIVPLASLALGLLLGATTAGAQQGGRDPDAALTDLGLSRDRSRYVFAEDERAVLANYHDAKKAVGELEKAQAKLLDGEALDQQVAALQAEERQMRAEIGSLRSAGGGSRYGGRAGRNWYRNQANAMIRQHEAYVGQLRSQIQRATKAKPNPKQKQLADLEARQARNRAEQAAKDVNSAYDALVERYEQARANPAVLKGLEDAGRARKMGFQLGPSEAADKAGRWAKSVLRIHPKKPTSHKAAGAATGAVPKSGDDFGPIEKARKVP